jgi:hypothetical protein
VFPFRKKCFNRVYKRPPSVTFYFEFGGVKLEWDCWALKIIKMMHFSKNGGGRRGKKRAELDQNERYKDANRKGENRTDGKVQRRNWKGEHRKAEKIEKEYI